MSNTRTIAVNRHSASGLRYDAAVVLEYTTDPECPHAVTVSIPHAYAQAPCRYDPNLTGYQFEVAHIQKLFNGCAHTQRVVIQ